MGQRLAYTRSGTSSETCLQMSANDHSARPWPNTGEERFTDPTSNPYEMPANDHYTYPASSSTMSSSHYYRGHAPNTPSSSIPHRDCNSLERSDQRMAIVFWILAVFCALVFFVYIVTIVIVFVSLSRMDSDPPPDTDSPRGSQREELCVDEEDFQKFQRNWDSGDQREIMHLLKNSSFVYHSKTEKYCFTTLEWVPQIMGKIRSQVQDSVSDIEEQQKKINEIVSGFTGANNNGSMCSVRETKKEAKEKSKQPGDAVYAHFFINNTEYPEKPAVTEVRLTLAGQLLSSRVGVGIVDHTGFLIQRSGFYFVYSTLVFKPHSHTVHRVKRKRGGVNSTLLESKQGPVSFLQGVFKLQTNDTLTITATAHLLYQGNNKMSYFGTYLIRT